MKHDKRKLTHMYNFPRSFGIGGPSNMEVNKVAATSA